MVCLSQHNVCTTAWIGLVFTSLSSRVKAKEVAFDEVRNSELELIKTSNCKYASRMRRQRTKPAIFYW